MQRSWNPGFSANDYTVDKDERVFDGYFKLHRLTIRHQRFQGGEEQVTRELFRRGNAVCALLYDPARDQVVMVEQFRIGAIKPDHSPWLLELVAGIVEPGETATDVAVRESQEEAGVAISNVRHLHSFMPSPGACDEWIDLVYAEVDASLASGIHGLDQEGEDIKVHVLSAEEVLALMAQGAITSGPAIIGLQWLALNRHDLKRT